MLEVTWKPWVDLKWGQGLKIILKGIFVGIQRLCFVLSSSVLDSVCQGWGVGARGQRRPQPSPPVPVESGHVGGTPGCRCPGRHCVLNGRQCSPHTRPVCEQVIVQAFSEDPALFFPAGCWMFKGSLFASSPEQLFLSQTIYISAGIGRKSQRATSRFTALAWAEPASVWIRML